MILIPLFQSLFLTWIINVYILIWRANLGFPFGGSDGKESAYNVGDLSRSLGWEDPREEGIATQSSILAWRISMDRVAWRATVNGVSESQTQLNDQAQHMEMNNWRLYFILHVTVEQKVSSTQRIINCIKNFNWTLLNSFRKYSVNS